jgi:hypothetical protein
MARSKLKDAVLRFFASDTAKQLKRKELPVGNKKSEGPAEILPIRWFILGAN